MVKVSYYGRVFEFADVEEGKAFAESLIRHMRVESEADRLFGEVKIAWFDEYDGLKKTLIMERSEDDYSEDNGAADEGVNEKTAEQGSVEK